MTHVCETCKQEFESPQPAAIYCKTGNNGKCKQIGHRERKRIYMAKYKARLKGGEYIPPKEKEMVIDAKYLVRGRIGDSRVLGCYGSSYESQF